jgi:hypothetical protein
VAKELVTDELWEIVEPLLPPEPPKPRGGRPRVPNRAALTGIVFVLKTGIPWEMSSPKSVSSILHRPSSGGQVVGSNNGPGIESFPCASFHFVTYSASSSVCERGNPSSLKKGLTWLSNP